MSILDRGLRLGNGLKDCDRANFLFHDFALLKLELSLAILVPNIVDLGSTHLARVGGANQE